MLRTVPLAPADWGIVLALSAIPALFGQVTQVLQQRSQRTTSSAGTARGSA